MSAFVNYVITLLHDHKTSQGGTKRSSGWNIVDYEGELRRVVAHRSEEGGFSFGDVENRIRVVFQFPQTSELKLTYQDQDGDIVTMANDQDLIDACVFQDLNPLRLKVALLPTTTAAPSSGPADMDVEAAGELSVTEYVEKLVRLTEGVFREFFTPDQMPEVRNHIVGRVLDNINFIVSSTQHKDSDRSEENRAIHLTVTCDVCKMTPIIGPRYKSMKKFDYDLCSKCCYKLRGNQAEYRCAVQPVPHRGPAFGKFPVDKQPTGSETVKEANGRKAEENTEVHPTVACDVCDMKPIVGPRYKSMKRWNYDLCGTCYAREGSAVEYRRVGPRVTRPDRAGCNDAALRPMETACPANMMWRSIPGMPFVLGPRGGRCRMGYVRG
ncbi:hypothetical protein R1sor_008679 [Riccia sorocarpa]|uniref:Uncharacterized protein n=1 Tax=Riccia sorocarpa TaxID=122646 RepID=A0ABD3HU62_9MARC